MIRLGLIGCGEHSESGHAIPLARYKNEHSDALELSAVCDIRLDRAELFREKYGFLRSYARIDHMLAEEKLDGCVAVVPVDKIPQVGSQLLNAHIACVLEKPLGSSLEDVTELLDSARITLTPNMVSVNRRFMPLLNRAITWARDNGNLRYVRCTFTRNRRTEPEFLWGTAVHAVDALRHIAGDIEKATSHALKRVEATADWYAIDVSFRSGVNGRIDVLPTAGVLDETYELIGEGYRVLVTCPFGPQRGVRCFREDRLVVEESAEGMPEDVLNGCYDEASAFISAVTTKQPLHPSVEEVFPSVELCWLLARQLMSETQSPVSIKS
jgi:predicted dehydrogenase